MKLKKTNNYLIVIFDDSTEYLNASKSILKNENYDIRYFTKDFVNNINALGVFSDTITTLSYYPKVVAFPINNFIVTTTKQPGYVQIGYKYQSSEQIKDRPDYFLISDNYITTTNKSRFITRKPFVMYETSNYGTYSTNNNFYNLIIYGDKKTNTIVLIVAIVLLLIIVISILYVIMNSFSKNQ